MQDGGAGPQVGRHDADRRRCVFDALVPLKQGVIRAAMGLDGELPALAKGEKI